MVDSNIIISAALFPYGYVSLALIHAMQEDTLILTQYVKDEVLLVANKKFPDHLDDIMKLMDSDLFVYENPNYLEIKLEVSIRDVKDVPVFLSAKAIDADILMTGDKDLLDVECKKPKILSPKEYLLLQNKLA